MPAGGRAKPPPTLPHAGQRRPLPTAHVGPAATRPRRDDAQGAARASVIVERLSE
jgi:hypothetical protein